MRMLKVNAYDTWKKSMTTEEAPKRLEIELQFGKTWLGNIYHCWQSCKENKWYIYERSSFVDEVKFTKNNPVW